MAQAIELACLVGTVSAFDEVCRSSLPIVEGRSVQGTENLAAFRIPVYEDPVYFLALLL